MKGPITLYTNTDIQKKHYCSTSVVQKENFVCMYIQMNDIEIYVTRIVFNNLRVDEEIEYIWSSTKFLCTT